ncbi:hypothetical protein PanWU01x14_022380 [Parasponia andersonii]|uniref:Uncharacterized protein n=1 Tax=Parasponia andersonii TaxID=3476 RepID=A0A2P5DX67_PARAD|nr:hypothetical protein PanWU01x14_022380 [Parasponia andersonii]
MVKSRFWVSFALILLLFPSSETRPINPSLLERILIGRNETLIESSRVLLDAESGKGEDAKATTGYNPNRRSPGGPDPWHHFQNDAAVINGKLNFVEFLLMDVNSMV